MENPDLLLYILIAIVLNWILLYLIIQHSTNAKKNTKLLEEIRDILKEGVKR